jgi:hypothetical protein
MLHAFDVAQVIEDGQRRALYPHSFGIAVAYERNLSL